MPSRDATPCVVAGNNAAGGADCIVNRFDGAIDRDKAIIAAIVRLAERRCPTAVVRFIVSGGINSVERHSVGPLADVG